MVGRRRQLLELLEDERGAYEVTMRAFAYSSRRLSLSALNPSAVVALLPVRRWVT